MDINITVVTLNGQSGTFLLQTLDVIHDITVSKAWENTETGSQPHKSKCLFSPLGGIVRPSSPSKLSVRTIYIRTIDLSEAQLLEPYELVGDEPQ